MSVAVSPDGRTLAVDLQGSIWTLPAAGGAATRITDIFNDARQPAWSPDGKWIAFFAYRDGGYDLWAIAPDGIEPAQADVGRRSTIASRPGRTTARASPSRRTAATRSAATTTSGRSTSRSGELRQLTKDAADDYMPTWSPDDKEIAFASTREDGQSVWAVNVADGAERKVATRERAASTRRRGGRAASSSITCTGGRGAEPAPRVDGYESRQLTGSENVFAFRASWASPTDFYYVSDGKIRKRSARRRRAADGRVHAPRCR